MSSTFTFYVVDERKLPSDMPGLSDTQRHEKLVSLVEANGARWGQLELRLLDFAEALETIDWAIDGDKFLPVFAFNNSPHNLLGNESDAPDFGYFSPEQARDLDATLRERSLSELKSDQADPIVLDQVLHAVRSAAAEAAKRGHALAIVHS